LNQFFKNYWQLLANGCSSGFPNAFLLHAKIKGFLKTGCCSKDLWRWICFRESVESKLLYRVPCDPFAIHVFRAFVDLLTWFTTDPL